MNYSTLAVDTMLDALGPQLNGGFADVYGHADGADSALGAQPTDSDTAITTQTKLASNQFGATAFNGADTRAIIANAITQATILATGYARFVRLTKADHTTVVADLSIGMANPAVNGAAARAATSVPVAALTAKVFNGDRLIVGGNKVATLTADKVLGDPALTVSALADSLAAGDTAAYDLLWDNTFLQVSAVNSISALTLTVSRGY